MTANGRHGWFASFATKVAHFSGHPAAFCSAALIVILWAVSGPFMGFSEVWQLTINTGTTIITFLMVFIIQSTQNRDTTSIQIKLDELIRATEAARNSTLDLEELSEEELEKLRQRYVALAQQTTEELEDTKEEKSTGTR